MSSNSPKFKPEHPTASDSLDNQKLKLEIIGLHKGTKRNLLPVITAVISVVGLIISVVIFGLQQSAENGKNRTARELERRTALQNRISSDTDELLRFTGDPKLSVSRAVFLLSDIKALLDSPVNQSNLDPAGGKPSTLNDVLGTYRQSLTSSLVVLVRDDCDFSQNPRDVELAKAIATNWWDDYAAYLKMESNLKKLDYILYKYTRALESLEYRHPGYLKSLHLDKDGLEPGPQYPEQNDEHITYNHFVNLVDGFNKHLDIIRGESSASAQNVRKGALEEFEGKMCNPDVSKYELGENFIGAPCTLHSNQERRRTWRPRRKLRKKVMADGLELRATKRLLRKNDLSVRVLHQGEEKTNGNEEID